MTLSLRFRRMVFFQVMLSVVAFGIVEGNPAMLLLTGSAGMLSWFVTEGPRSRPMPRWLVNLGSLLAVAWLAIEVTLVSRGQLVTAMGHFTIWLAVLLLYARKTHREYAQLLVLSMLIMVGGSVLSVSVVYGMLLAVYCVVAVLTLLLFHLKSSSDAVTEAMRHASGRAIPAADIVTRGRLSSWQLRSTAAFIAVACAVVASLVFVSAPRRPDRTLPERLATSLQHDRVGFAREVDLSRPGPGSGGRSAVLNLTLADAAGPLDASAGPLMLRGAVLDTYDPATARWRRHHQLNDLAPTFPPGTSNADFAAGRHAQIVLRDTSGGVLFTLAGTQQVAGPALPALSISNVDGQVSMQGDVPGSLAYGIDWGAPPRPTDPFVWRAVDPRAPRATRFVNAALRSALIGWQRGVNSTRDQPFGSEQRIRRWYAPDETRDNVVRLALANYARDWPVRRARVAATTRRVLRDADVPVTPTGQGWRDRVAETLKAHFRSEFTYRTDNPVPRQGVDPTTDFLFEHQQGHCELFASGAAAMLRSIHIPARLVSGYLATEYNSVGGYFVVRTGDAHAWVEYQREDGVWVALDVTPPAEVAQQHARSTGWWTAIIDAFEHAEFVWLRSVLTFDEHARIRLWSDLADGVTETTEWLASPAERVRLWTLNLVDLWRVDRAGTLALLVVAGFLVVAIAVLIRVGVVRRRRVAALQLDTLPVAQRRTLVRRLYFYLQMLDMLERHGFIRPPWQSPFAFAQELADAHPMRFDPVVALTEMFYEVRFGHRALDTAGRQRVRTHLRRLEQTLGS
ncbi:MAG: transglutaminaseTgpA domain-containing protein [Planctomycetota bacterium]